jgi:hypothetical protein
MAAVVINHALPLLWDIEQAAPYASKLCEITLSVVLHRRVVLRIEVAHLTVPFLSGDVQCRGHLSRSRICAIVGHLLPRLAAGRLKLGLAPIICLTDLTLLLDLTGRP